MDDDERCVLTMLGYAWDVFTTLPPGHSDDLADFKHAIHTAQRIIMARAAARANPSSFRRTFDVKA